MACVRQPQLKCFLYMTLISLLLQNALATLTTLPMSLLGCPDKCGNITIPYPFGIGPDCSRDDEFLVACNKTNPPKALVGSESSNIELIGINISTGQARVYKHIAFRCFNQANQIYSSNNESSTSLDGTPYLFSDKHNKFTAIGCDTYVVILNVPYLTGCLSSCINVTTSLDGGSCNGYGCCQAPMPPGLNYYEVGWLGDNNSAWLTNPCLYAVLVEEDWYKFQKKDLTEDNFLRRNPNGVPVVLDWAIRKNGTCQYGVEKSSKPACLSKNTFCYNTTNGDGYLCYCSRGYEGNPYLPNGCTDIDECLFPDFYPCLGTCSNTEGDYQCTCPSGTDGNGKTGVCIRVPRISPLPNVFMGLGSCMMGIPFLLFAFEWCRRYRKEKLLYQKYYKMMDNQLKVFSKRQIKIATNNFDENYILGFGGRGKVFKGVLDGNKTVAIKLSKEIEESQREEFVNEIVLLSQINHKSIVKLLGCCLEDKIPMLVYEFVPNGTLFELLHRSNSRPLPLGTRLKIATESAEALDYLHSTISRPIIHGDVKSANILLAEGYCAKVSDFGASNIVPADNTQVVELFQWTVGYLDPECFCSQTVTKGSDVYSFGVVILELITRKKAVYRDDTDQRKHLASEFVSTASNSEVHEMLDAEIVTYDDKVIEVLKEMSELAIWCVSAKREDRPTMKQVAEKLQFLVRIYGTIPCLQIDPQESQSLLGEQTFYTASDTINFPSSTGLCGTVMEIETGSTG